MVSSSSSLSKRKLEMEENASHGMAPARPSPPAASDGPFHRYDVFINHRGPDVKNTLVSILYQFLQYLGLKVFVDSTELEVGGFLSDNIQHAIRRSRVHIAIFSKGYANSPWCLAELQLMLETRAKIVPLFYDVAPSDLRYVEKGVYAEAFCTHQEKGRYTNEKIHQWKQALQEVAYGIEFHTPNR